MPANQEPEIHSPDNPEIEQQNVPEFDQSTDHPQEDDTRVQSQEMR
jgi:hypothetical protein